VAGRAIGKNQPAGVGPRPQTDADRTPEVPQRPSHETLPSGVPAQEVDRDVVGGDVMKSLSAITSRGTASGAGDSGHLTSAPPVVATREG
jgi:hypothetical protein